jgi:hypothetical protein
MGTPSAQTLVEFASEFFRELEEVPMTMVGGFDVRCYHTLRELGDAALAMPIPEDKRVAA